MRKLIVLISALVLGSSAAKADSYLYWLIGPVEEDLAFDYAQIWYTDSSGNMIAALTVQGTTETDIWSDPGSDYRATSEVYSLLPENYQDYKYIVELFADEMVIGTSQLVAYSLLKESVYTPPSQSGVQPWNFSSSVPEPSGGLLCLLGFGLMALRRRREKV